MGRTADQLVALMKLHAGVSQSLDLPPELTWYDILNIAGEEFVNKHSWSWLEEERATVNAVMGDENLPIPRDFVALTSVRARNAGSQAVRLVGRDRIEELRSQEDLATSSGFWYVCLDAGVTQSTPGGDVIPAGLVWPIPSANGEPSLRMVYQRGWWKILPSDGARVIKIGAWCEAAFLLHCEITAWEKLHNKPSPRRDKYDVVLRDAIDRDEERCENVGQVGDLRRGDDCDEDFVIPEWTPS